METLSCQATKHSVVEELLKRKDEVFLVEVPFLNHVPEKRLNCLYQILRLVGIYFLNNAQEICRLKSDVLLYLSQEN